MARTFKIGMDNPYYEWSPIVKRGRLEWPDGARVALCVIINLGHTEFKPLEGTYQNPMMAGGFAPPQRPYPDLPRYSHREYGHRVGVFRLLRVLEKHGVTPTIAMDSSTAENYPYLVKYCLDRNYEIMAHGVAATQMITSKMSEQQEMKYIHGSIAAIKKATGSAPHGWLGPEYGESARTPKLLAEAGINYVCDWANDEQPYLMTTEAGEMVALPIMYELDDIAALWDRHVPIRRYNQLIRESFDTLYEDGAQNGRSLVLHLHPWLTGQPLRIKYIDDAIGYIAERDKVWAATGGQITDWYRENRPN